ncbi:MAG: hypothetical protein GF353_04185 [Candidatus Lokiarchaeota archaeon]|nr:hypothetical protein [Candidatus Lokiarchaeota archaeon]
MEQIPAKIQNLYLVFKKRTNRVVFVDNERKKRCALNVRNNSQYVNSKITESKFNKQDGLQYRQQDSYQIHSSPASSLRITYRNAAKTRRLKHNPMSAAN